MPYLSLKLKTKFYLICSAEFVIKWGKKLLHFNGNRKVKVSIQKSKVMSTLIICSNIIKLLDKIIPNERYYNKRT